MSEMVLNGHVVRAELRDFVLRYGRDVDPVLFDDRSPLLDDRLLTSLQVPELLLLIESLRGREINVLDLQPGDLQDIHTIVARFFP